MAADIMEEQFPNDGELMLYGQHDYVARVKTYLERLRPDLHLSMTEIRSTTEEIDASEFDFSVMDESLTGYNIKRGILICLPAKWQAVAQAHLQGLGYNNLHIYDASLDNKLKMDFFKAVYDEQGKSFVIFSEMPAEHENTTFTLIVYMARCEVDKPLSKEPILSEYVVPIQVGAALTNKRIAELTDNTGDNISERNRCYSETTALYWMWKNAKSDWLGLCHYRRIFLNMDEIASKLQQVNVDALLPLPTLCEHSVYEDYLFKHTPAVWKPMMDVLKVRSPEYYEAAEQIFKGKIFYASNMFILRRDVLNDLCQWMFPIVMEVEKQVGELEDTYYNRYAGFCTERLITLYFLYNKCNWRIAHVEKQFLN